MNLAQRFSLLVRGNMSAVFDRVENPEHSLDQLIVEMVQQLEAAKRATAQAMANEDRLRARIAYLRKDSAELDDAGRSALDRDDEQAAREALRLAEVSNRQAERLQTQLGEQMNETHQIRASVARMHERIGHARARMQVLQARLRQGEARHAINHVLRKASASDLYGEFERLSERVEMSAATESNYLRLDDALSGDDVRRRFEHDAIDDAVEQRLASLRESADPTEPHHDGAAA